MAKYALPMLPWSLCQYPIYRLIALIQPKSANFCSMKNEFQPKPNLDPALDDPAPARRAASIVERPTSFQNRPRRSAQWEDGTRQATAGGASVSQDRSRISRPIFRGRSDARSGQANLVAGSVRSAQAAMEEIDQRVGFDDPHAQ